MLSSYFGSWTAGQNRLRGVLLGRGGLGAAGGDPVTPEPSGS
jgi:hypothetical protein